MSIRTDFSAFIGQPWDRQSVNDLARCFPGSRIYEQHYPEIKRETNHRPDSSSVVAVFVCDDNKIRDVQFVPTEAQQARPLRQRPALRLVQ